ncbi:MAG: TspO/MBR family protein [Hyphomicrobiales bacterium]
MLGLCLLCLAAGGLGSWLTAPSLDPWYAGLAKPSFNPPNWIFAPVWTTLFLFMAYAAWRIWQVSSTSAGILQRRRQALVAFAIQLVFTVWWSAAFFFAQNPGFGLLVIALLALSVATVMVLFFMLDRLAGLLFVPYLLWVLFASALNLSIFLLN